MSNISKKQRKRESNGRLFENKILSLLNDNNYWAIKLQTGRTGTPFDILTVKNKEAIGLECKHFQDMPKTIRMTHLRDNQIVGLHYFNQFARSYIVFGNIYDIRIIDSKQLLEKESIEIDDCEKFLEE